MQRHDTREGDAACKLAARTACTHGVDLERQCDECALTKWAQLVEHDERLRTIYGGERSGLKRLSGAASELWKATAHNDLERVKAELNAGADVNEQCLHALALLLAQHAEVGERVRRRGERRHRDGRHDAVAEVGLARDGLRLGAPLLLGGALLLRRSRRCREPSRGAPVPSAAMRDAPRGG